MTNFSESLRNLFLEANFGRRYKKTRKKHTATTAAVQGDDRRDRACGKQVMPNDTVTPLAKS